MRKAIICALGCALSLGTVAAAHGPRTRTVNVDCDAGETIEKALQKRAVDLDVVFTGLCDEDVLIVRDRTTLRSDGSGVIDGTVTVDGATNVVLEDFSAVNGRGVRVANGGSAAISRVRSTDTAATFGIGFSAQFSSSAVLTDVTASDNFFAGILATGNSFVRLLGTVSVSGSSTAGIFVGGSSEIDSRANPLTVHDNAFAGLFAQSGGSAFFSTIDSIDNGSFGARAVVGADLVINGGTVSGSAYGVYLDNGSSAELSDLTVSDGGVSVVDNSSLRASNLTIGGPDPDFGYSLVVQASHLLTFGGSVDNSIYLAEAGQANFAVPPAITGSLDCHPTAIAWGGLACPP